MRILIADDEASSRKMLELVLKDWGYDVLTARNGAEAWSILSRPDAPTLAILDWVMPNMEGPEICRRLRRGEPDRYTYVILLTVRDDTKDIVSGIDAGADDYITKPFDPGELRARLNAAQRQLRVHERLMAAQETIRREAMHDPLTGVLTRGAILETLRREHERTAREELPLAIVMLDMDGFKGINDTYGHQGGDEALRYVGKALQVSVRSYDSIGRYGGDEFLAVLPGLNGSQAMELSQRLRQAIQDAPVLFGEQSIPLAVSAGIAVAETPPRLEVKSLIHAADQALYIAKRAGRNRVELFQ